MEERLTFDEHFHLDSEFREMVTNRDLLKKTLHSFLNHTMDEFTLGIIFEIHRSHKDFGLDPEPEPQPDLGIGTSGLHDIFGFDNLRKIQINCDCPNCDHNVSAARYAAHLEKCMGLGRKNNPRRGTTHSINSNSSNSNNSTKDKDEDASEDPDDDVEWNSRQKTRKRKRNKSKKGKGTPKKGSNILSDIDSVNVDVEGDDDGDIMLRDIMQDNSNQSSPAESVASSNASKKRDKSSKSKKSKRDRNSPNSIMDKK